MPSDLPPWVFVYLAKLAETGGKTLSANVAGVTPRLARQLEDSHSRFAEAAANAVDFYADLLAKDVPGTSKPIGNIARLKSIRPAEYETALIVSTHNTLNVDAGAPPPGAKELLARMMAHISPMEVAAMNGDIIDVDPVTGEWTSRPSLPASTT